MQCVEVGKRCRFLLDFFYFFLFINMTFKRDVYGKMIQDSVA